jgi:predicted nucleic acid-binding protein
MSDSIIDACCLINFYAVERREHWLTQLGLRWHIPRSVCSEALYLRDTDADGNRINQPIELQPLIDGNVLHLCHADEPREKQLYIELVTTLDDGEAMALALAACRGWILATDDRKARILAEELDVTVLTTPDVMKLWVDKTAPAQEHITNALRAIRDRAKFLPPHSSPLYSWWMQFL